MDEQTSITTSTATRGRPLSQIASFCIAIGLLALGNTALGQQSPPPIPQEAQFPTRQPYYPELPRIRPLPVVQMPAAMPAPNVYEQLPTPPPPVDQVTRPTTEPVKVRIKDITTIAGPRSHRVGGWGLVTGLGGTGGKDETTRRFAESMLKNSNILFDNANLSTRNLAAVRVTGEIPPFLKVGEKFNVRVAAFGDAKSLYNGNLEITELQAIDKNVYALAGGAVLMGGFSAEGAAGGIQKNHVTVGSVSAQLEVELCEDLKFKNNQFELLLRNKDLATAVRIAAEINAIVPNGARPLNAGVVSVNVPREFDNSKLEFVAMVNSLEITPDMAAKIVVNQKTGTLVVGHRVRLSNVMFANSNLVITTNETPQVSQPAPFSDGQTVVVPRTSIVAQESNSRYNLLYENPTVGDLATALNTIGVTPQDLISILHSLKAQGSLQAELIVQ